MSLLNEYQLKIFRLNVAKQFNNPGKVLEHVNGKGFLFFWSLKEDQFPSLSAG